MEKMKYIECQENIELKYRNHRFTKLIDYNWLINVKLTSMLLNVI